MRLINTNSLEIKEFLDLTQAPPYAILSHRWTDDEMTYKDFAKGHRKSSAGYRKIEQFCHWIKKERPKVRSWLDQPIPPQRVEWIWIDTACIDKRSSAELSEAINSMYQWYREAAFCVAYLADIANFPTQEQLATSEWFERGWTLQELLAPDEVIFCSKTWREFGRKGRGQTSFLSRLVIRPNHIDTNMMQDKDNRFLESISSITGIASEYLHLPSTVKSANFAEILSWAASRKTSRAEDMAYCLLGLLDINMPLLYGEGGQKAFMRLQYLFIQQSVDESIFIFQDRDPPLHVTGMLAVEPAQFLHCISNDRSRPAVQRAPFYVTHKGLYIEGPVWKIRDEVKGAQLYLMALNWRARTDSTAHMAHRVVIAGGPKLHAEDVVGFDDERALVGFMGQQCFMLLHSVENRATMRAHFGALLDCARKTGRVECDGRPAVKQFYVRCFCV